MSETASARAERFHAIPGHDPDDLRSPYRRDRDRILYSSAFRRLSGITQVVSPSGSHPTHNRLTHSLEVAQIGRSIAERLLHEADADTDRFDRFGGLDPDVVEAAALAHDLGHPPFGHVAETTLNDLLTESRFLEGFEGNAQSFRIVNRLSTRYRNVEGLNLTRATLSAMSKYPWTRSTADEHSRKWGAYDSEKQFLSWSRQHLGTEFQERQTLEAAIMDLSDDFAYAVHDLEDFYRVGLVPLDRLTNSHDERERFIESHLQRSKDTDESSRREVLEELVSFFPPEPYSGSRYSRAILRILTSRLINSFVTAVRLHDTTGRPEVSDAIRIQVELLKSMTWHYVIHSRALVTTRYGYATVIRSLFAMLTDATRTGDGDRRPNIGIFPEFYAEHLIAQGADSQRTPRTVADTIASLTEAQAISLHQRLTGNSLGAVLDPIL